MNDGDWRGAAAMLEIVVSAVFNYRAWSRGDTHGSEDDMAWYGLMCNTVAHDTYLEIGTLAY